MEITLTSPTELTRLAAEWQLPLLVQPRRTSEAFPAFVDAVRRLAPDLILVDSYSMLLPPQVLDAAPLGGVNVHGALLPRHRGANPIQWAILNDERITKNYRVIVFDMPWHGKSSPPVGWENEEYRLTSRDYVRMILEVSAALELDRPVVMGCSIGGRIVLHLAHEHPEKFRAIIGLESSPKVDPYYDTSWLHRADVQGETRGLLQRLLKG